MTDLVRDHGGLERDDAGAGGWRLLARRESAGRAAAATAAAAAAPAIAARIRRAEHGVVVVVRMRARCWLLDVEAAAARGRHHARAVAVGGQIPASLCSQSLSWCILSSCVYAARKRGNKNTTVLAISY